MEYKNHGVLPRIDHETAWVAGAIPYEVRNESGNWYPYLVQGEKQYFSNFDTMSCVSFATNNVMEIQIKHQTGVEKNFSDRYLAKLSGTTQRGNYVSTVLDTFRKFGAVDESVWPKPAEPTTWESYMSDIPQSVIDQAEKYDVQYEYVGNTPDAIKYHLKHAPLLITVPGHEVTGVVVDADDTHLTILDDYIFNVDPNQPFVRKTKISDITDVYKAVLTIKNMNQTKVVLGKDGKTVWLATPVSSMAVLNERAGVEGFVVPPVIPPAATTL